MAAKYNKTQHATTSLRPETLGFTEALAKYDIKRNKRFASLAAPLIRFRHCRCCAGLAPPWSGRRHARRPVTCMTYRDATAEQVSAAVGCPLHQAQAALDRLESFWHGHDEYIDDPAVDDDDLAPAAPRTRAPARAPDLIERAADECDRRAMRRLKLIGRRAYALELVERDRQRIAARADPEQYLYPTHEEWRLNVEPVTMDRREAFSGDMYCALIDR